MTARLEHAIRQLPPEKVEELTDYAEMLVHGGKASGANERFQLGWVGKGAHLYPEHISGVDAANAAGQMIIESIERPVSK